MIEARVQVRNKKTGSIGITDFNNTVIVTSFSTNLSVTNGIIVCHQKSVQL